MAQQFSKYTQAHCPNMYSTLLLAFHTAHDLKQYEVEHHFGCKEHAESGRASPLCMQITSKHHWCSGTA